MKTLVIESPFESQSGYGHRSKDLVYSFIELYKDVYDIKLISLNWANSVIHEISDLNQYKIKVVDYTPDVYIFIGVPNESIPKGKFNILVTAGIESNLCSREWIQSCNLMDLIIVPSNHSKNVFLNSCHLPENTNVTKSIEVLFEGVDFNKYFKTNDCNEYLNNQLNQIPENFNFLFVGQWLPGIFGHDRKNIAKLIDVFCKTFDKCKIKPGLILKTSIQNYSEIDKSNIEKRILSIKQNRNVNIYVLHGELSDVEINQLYNHNKIKSFITFTKGEGWCRDLSHFSTCGKPIIASNYSGHLDFLNKDFTILINGKMEYVHQSASNSMLLSNSEWFAIDENEAAEQMLNVYNSYENELKKSNDQSEYIKQFGLENMKIKLNEIITNYIK